MKTPVIPARQIFARKKTEHSLNYKAICIFASTGFFLGEDTYFNDVMALQPFTEYLFDENDYVISSDKYWSWHYNPKDVSLKQSTEEFAHLFEKIVSKNLNGKKIILPLSGGIDSRTQAAAIEDTENIFCYSYKFDNSFDETKYGRMISEARGFKFKEYVIEKGYLWNVIDRLAEINMCFADFTHPRQMAVIDDISKQGDVFFLGHWGDVLFDDMRVADNLTNEEQTEIVIKKIIKKGGKELSEKLWEAWGLDGNFIDYLKERISVLLKEIKIENANSKVRAFKSMYWAPRWTSANMNVFSDFRPVYLPYYSDEMCEFICGIPESILSGRKIQIEYIKMKNPQLAKIPWQTYDPFNLYNYGNYDKPANIPARALGKLKRVVREKIFNKKNITRNWELQFAGDENENKLKSFLYEEMFIKELVPEETVNLFFNKFKADDPVIYSHPVSMLLTLSLFVKHFYKNTDVSG